MKDSKGITIIVLSALLIFEGLAGSYFIYQANNYKNERDALGNELTLVKSQLDTAERESSALLNTANKKLSEFEEEETDEVLTGTDESIESDSGEMIVTSPKPDSLANGTVIVTGRARAFENIVSIRLKDADGKMIVDTFTTAEGADIGEFSKFNKTIHFSVPKTSAGTIEVFEVSPKDGAEINKVTIDLIFFEEVQ